MKKNFTTIILAGMALYASAQSTPLPYKSDMFVTYSTLDEGWTTYTGDNSKPFEYDRDNTGSALATPGTSSAAYHAYDSDNAANCWLFSPAFDLKAGGNYIVGVWAKTKGSDPENFKMCYGTTAEVSAMTVTVFDKQEYQHSDDYEFVSATVVPESDMTVHFGIQCYSPANRYVLSLTGFSISDENGSTDVPDVPDTPVEAVDLPFAYNFTSSATFAKDWKCASGPNTEVTTPWTMNEFSGWAYFDAANGVKEDNWLISNPLKFTEAGNYAVVYTGLVYGKLEFLLGTDPNDLSTFTPVATLEYNDDSYNNDAEYVLPFEFTQTGEYRLAVRACVEAGSFMGYRLKTIKLRSDKPTPAVVADLTAVPDGNDGLSVELAWTNPSTDHAGKPLAELSRLELYRNGEKIKDDFTNLTVGAPNTWTDTPAEAGVYTYHILAYNSNGCADATPVKADAGFVGRPVAQLPYLAEPGSPETMVMMTACDANGDGKTWQYVEGEYSWSNSMEIELEVDDVFDDYIMSPYIHLTPGYYTFSFSSACRYNSFEAGYAKDRHNPAPSFVKVAEVLNYQDWSAYSEDVVISIKEEGDYVFGLHAIGTCSNSSYTSISLNRLSVTTAQRLPKAVTGLKVVDDAAEEGFDVTLTWTNPTLDNAGQPLEDNETLTITVYRDGESVATLSGEEYGPGSLCTWVDKGLAPDKDYKYTVGVANVNGASDEDNPEVSIHVGPILTLPYETSDFSEWIIDDSGSYPWKIDATTKYAVWDGVDAWYPTYTIYTPYLRLEEGKRYLLEATFDYNTGATQDMKLVSTPSENSYDRTELGTFSLPEGAVDHVVHYVLSVGEVNALSDESTPEAETITVPEGKFILGFRVSEAGKITLKKFSLKVNPLDGVTNVDMDEDGVYFANGVVSYPTATEITVADLAGRILRTAHAATIDLSDLRGAGVVIVTASGYRALKLAL